MKLYFNVLAYIFIFFFVFYCLWNNPYIATIDGPTHFANGLILKELLEGNQFVHQHFQLNYFFIPNNFSTYLLVVLYYLFPNLLAIKIFYFILLAMFVFSFHYFNKVFNHKKYSFYSIIAVIFFNTFLMNYGFFNFNFSVCFLLLAISDYYRLRFSQNKEFKLSHYLKYLFISILIYFTNGLAFIVFQIFILIFEMILLFRIYNTEMYSYIKKNINHYVIMMFLSAPFFYFLYLFRKYSKFSNGSVSISLDEIKTYLLSFSPFNVFVYDTESKFSQVLLFSLFIYFTYILFFRLKNKIFLQPFDAFIFISMFFLILLFIVPEDYSVGYMSVRFVYLFYFFIILWLLSQPENRIKKYFILILSLGFVIKYEFYHKKTLNYLNKQIKEIIYASNFIDKNSTVAVLNNSQNWVECHYGSYLGILKNIIILDNYEAGKTFFPILWNSKDIPTYNISGYLGYKNFYWNISFDHTQKNVDYVFVYCGEKLLNELKDLTKNYFLLYKNKNSTIHLYKLVGFKQ